MHKFFSIINKVLTIFVVIILTGQSVVQAQPPQQDGKPRIDYSDSTGKVVFIGADTNAPIVVRAAKAPGLSKSESALAMASQYETDFGLRDAESELQLLSENQVGNRNVTRFQQVYQGIPVIAGEMVVNATDNAGLLSLSGEIAPDLDINIKPTITPQKATKTATELIRKAYNLTAAEITFTTPELWIYDSRLLHPDGTAPALVWRIEAQAQNNLSVNEFILIDATRGHIALNFNQVDTAWNDAGTGKVENEDTPQTATPTPTPIVPTSTPEAPQTDIQPTATLPAEKPETNQPDKSAPQPQLGVNYYVDIATGNNSNSCTTPASPCKDIQETINKAGTGDIIKVASGVYIKSTNPSPNVVINNGKNLTLSGGWNSTFTTQSGVSTIDGQNTNNGYLQTGGTVTIENFIIQNSTSADSGAIYMVSGTLTIKRSTLKNNSANRGSGIFMAGSGTLTVENSTISGNTATTSGAGMFLANGTGASVTIRNSTISNNTTTGGGNSGGGITQANSASITLTNSIVANNTASSNPDCNGTLSNASYNIIENASGCTITSSSNNSNVDPLLSANLSGTFQVHTPQAGSPAINGGTNTGCPSTDQLGNLRPQGASCDMGSVEFGQNTIIVLSGNNQFAAVNTAFSAPLSVIVQNALNQPVSGVNVTFTTPNSGASATFSATGTNTTIVTTDTNGIATTSSLTANNSSGSYTVVASAAGYSSASLQLTNTLGDPNGRYVSTTGSDTSNTCNSPATPCQTINWAISQASAGNTIYVAEGTYFGSGTEVVSINKNITLSGGWNPTFTTKVGYSTIDGQGVRRGITNTGSNVTINYFLIQNGYDNGTGGGILNINNGSLILNNSKVAYNWSKWMGGGIFNLGTLTINASSISDNTAGDIGMSGGGGGGGIQNYSGTVTINNSSVSKNTIIGSFSGSGINSFSSGVLILSNSTISNNKGGSGEGIYSNGTITLNNSTISGNQSYGFNNAGSSVTLKNTIISGNGGNSDCYNSGTVTSQGYNLITNTQGCGFTAITGDIVNVDPKLGSLMGFPEFIPLLVGSPAIDAGNPTTPGSGGNACLPTDQRGITRPQGSRCDIGATEYAVSNGIPVSLLIIAGNPQRTAPNHNFPIQLQVAVLDNYGIPIPSVNVTFTAPASGASGTFLNTGTVTTNTISDSNGIATASAFKANNQTGSYIVSASVSGLGTVNFSLANIAWYVATTGNDGNDCATPASPCSSINGAIGKAVITGDTIVVASGTYFGSGIEVVLINKAVTISGGWNPTFTTQVGYSTIDGQGVRRGITNTSSNVTVEHLIIQNGFNSYDGGGIRSSSSITLNNSIVTNNWSQRVGGGIFSFGSLTINNSIISENTVGETGVSGGGGGGGIQAGSVTLNNSSVINNTILGGFDGSGINAGGVVVNNSTISNNKGGSGEGIYSINGTITLNNSTISGNQSYGFKNSGGSVTLKNTIISGNGGNSDCYNSGTITSQGYNLVSKPQNCGFTPTTGDIVNTDAKLGSLISFPGHLFLLPNSPAIDAGNPSTPGSGGNACLATDQQGTARPQGTKCDIGAIEFTRGGTVPAYIVNYQGSPQSIMVSTQAPINFGVFVIDATGKAVANATVTFTAPVSGASGKFANNTTSTTAQTDSNGAALASTFTSNAITGSYSVTATVQGVAATISFALSNVDANIYTYTLNQTTFPLPGQFLCGINNLACTNGANLDADKAHIFAYGTYNFYKNHHGRQSINNLNMDIISSVDYGSGYQNANWSGTQMVYGDGYPLADDVVAHELTHGVTQYESNLFYYYQSGAINESFSDVWGELYDQENGLGNDTPGVKWLMGEDLPSGTIRSMSNPPTYGDPDKMTSTYYNTTSSDNGGVHTNSGINNKAAYLMVDGGTFNGRTVTALGANKTLAIYYETQTNLLSSGADYGDLYNLLYQACLNLVNGPDGITNANCQEVRDATDAVEMNLQPVTNFNTDAPLCGPSQTVVPAYQDGFESGLGSWTINNGATPRWQLDSPYGPFAHSGSHFLYGNDYPQSGVVTDATAQWSSKLIPAGAYLHFAHAYDFETSSLDTYNFDGGVLEYSTNGGATWVDAGSLIEYNGYKGVIYPDYINPLAGRYAFVGSSHGYISTRLNLASLAGQNVSFRWRMGLDDSVFRWGWWVDDVQIYTCSNGVTISGTTGTSGVVLSYTNGTPKTVTTDVNGNYSFNVPIGWSGTVTPSHACYTFSPASRSYSNLSTSQTNQNYTPTFTAVNGCASTNVTIGGVSRGTYGLAPGSSQRVNYAGLDAGPVVVDATNDVPIIAALRDAYFVNGQVESFVQLMGLPEAQLSTKYYFPAYNNVTLDGQLRFGNVGNSNTTVTVTIAGVVRGTYDLTPGQAKRVNYTGLDAGPVIVESSGGVPIIAALRDAYFVNGQIESFAQLMGLPASQLSDTYYFPAYNNVSLNGQLRVGNVDSVSTTVTVTIAGVLRGTYPLAPNEAVRINYAGLDAGPVVVQSSGGVKIIAALRDAYFVNGQVTSFVQLMGLPASQLSTKYYFPAYNNVSLDGQLRFGNVGNSNTTVTVTIGGVVRGTYNLAPGQAQRVNYAGLDAGPVVVESSGGVPIIAALRDAYFVNGQIESFAQLMGLPDAALSPTYYFPAYNNVSLNGQLRFGVP